MTNYHMCRPLTIIDHVFCNICHLIHLRHPVPSDFKSLSLATASSYSLFDVSGSVTLSAAPCAMMNGVCISDIRSSSQSGYVKPSSRPTAEDRRITMYNQHDNHHGHDGHSIITCSPKIYWSQLCYIGSTHGTCHSPACAKAWLEALPLWETCNQWLVEANLKPYEAFIL